MAWLGFETRSLLAIVSCCAEMFLAAEVMYICVLDLAQSNFISKPEHGSLPSYSSYKKGPLD